jgi:pyrroline-5-carboxylate reductase
LAIAKMKIAFVGGGNMANAIISGLLQKGVAAGQISVVEIDEAARARLSERLQVVTTSAVAEAVQDVRRCVGRQTTATAEVASQLRPQLVRQLVVVLHIERLRGLARWLGGYARIVRAMPNTLRWWPASPRYTQCRCGRGRPTNCGFDFAERRHHSLG